MMRPRVISILALGAALAAGPAIAQTGTTTTTSTQSSSTSQTTGQSQSQTTSSSKTTPTGAYGVQTESSTTTRGSSSSSTSTKGKSSSATSTVPTWNGGPRTGGSGSDAVGALLGILDDIADRNAPRVAFDEALGLWEAVASDSGGGVCGVELLSEPVRFGQGGTKLKVSRCRGLLATLFMWRHQDGAVVLIRHGGYPVATLRGDGARLSGRTSDGVKIVLYRAGY